MDEQQIDVRELAPLIRDIHELQDSIRRRLRPFFSELSPHILSLVGTGLADLVRDPTIRYIHIEFRDAPPDEAHEVMDLHGLKRLLPKELRRLRAMVARYGVPELTFALLTEPDTLRTAEARLAEGGRRHRS